MYRSRYLEMINRRKGIEPAKVDVPIGVAPDLRRNALDRALDRYAAASAVSYMCSAEGISSASFYMPRR